MRDLVICATLFGFVVSTVALLRASDNGQTTPVENISEIHLN